MAGGTTNTQLSWQPGFSLLRKPVRKTIVRRIRRSAPRNVDGVRQFEFIAEQPVKACETRHSSADTTLTDARSFVEHPVKRDRNPGSPSEKSHHVRLAEDTQSVLADQRGGYVKSRFVNDVGLSIGKLDCLRGAISPLGSSTSADLDGVTQDVQVPISSYSNTNDGAVGSSTKSVTAWNVGREQSSQIAITKSSGLRASGCLYQPCYPSIRMPSGIRYSDLVQRFKPILDRYDQEFCQIPLTFNLDTNPFRCQINVGSRSMFLVHAVMALAGHHVESAATQDHRHAALQLLRQSLNAQDIVLMSHAILDTIIVLFSLDETQSITGSWSTHLTGAYRLIEACGGVHKWITSAKTRAQVAMLVWWDAVINLVSREECLFPYTYFEAALSDRNGHRYDFFGLCGCPAGLVTIIMQLVRLSPEKQKPSLTRREPSCDNTTISNLEQSLESWQHVSPSTEFEDEESMQRDQDTMHCSEAWKNALLLYIHRLYHWTPGDSIPTRVLHRARVVLDHVSACRENSMLQKQALLPLFFAGCELRDPWSRSKITRFCSFWDHRTRYHLFNDTIPLLEDVWTEQETRGFENVWWGDIVDRRHSSQSCHPLRLRLCFG